MLVKLILIEMYVKKSNYSGIGDAHQVFQEFDKTNLQLSEHLYYYVYLSEDEKNSFDRELANLNW